MINYFEMLTITVSIQEPEVGVLYIIAMAKFAWIYGKMVKFDIFGILVLKAVYT